MAPLIIAKTGKHIEVTMCWLGPAAGPRLAHLHEGGFVWSMGVAES